MTALLAHNRNGPVRPGHSIEAILPAKNCRVDLLTWLAANQLGIGSHFPPLDQGPNESEFRLNVSHNKVK